MRLGHYCVLYYINFLQSSGHLMAMIIVNADFILYYYDASFSLKYLIRISN